MDIPFTGYFAIFILFFSLLFGRKSLLFLAVFFMPFSAVSVLNFSESKNSISYPLFFSIIYVVVTLFIRGGWVKILRLSFFHYGLFFLTYLFVCYFLYPSYDVQDFYINERSFFQLAYVLIGFFVSLSILIDVHKYCLFFILCKAILWSMFVVGLIGEYQLISYYAGWYYPSELFNNNINPFSNGYTAVLEGGIKRISSVSTEPSILSQWLVVCLSFFLFLNLYGFKINRFTYFVIVNSLVVLIASTSATAYLGVFMMLLFYFFGSFKKSILNFFLSLLILFSIFLSSQKLMVVVLDKINSYSFYERFGSVVFGWEQFINSPIIGMGIGVVTVHNLLVGLLANTGLIGTVIFLLWIASEIVKSLNDKKLFSFKKPAAMSFILLLIIQLLTGFSYVYPFFWVFFGLLAAANLNDKFFKGYETK